MKRRKPNKVLASDLIELRNSIVLEEFTIGRFNKLKIEKVARICFVILGIDLKVLQGK
jgi:hypothetical protein